METYRAKVEFYREMAETSGSGVPQSNTISHRKAVLPYSAVGSRWERVSATTVCINSTFALLQFLFSNSFFSYGSSSSLGYLLKYSLVIFAVRPLKAMSDTQFGMAMRPFVMSAIVQTWLTVRYGPMKTAAM